MEELPRDSRVFRFGVFEVDLRTGELRKKGLEVRLQEQPFQILALLLEHPGELVTREELRQKLWPGEIVVEFDQGLNNAIKKLRRALDDSAETPHFIETLPRRGYRFVAPVDVAGPHLFGGEKTPEQPRRRTGRRLARAGLVLAAVVVVGLAGLLLRRRFLSEAPAAPSVMLAILPFDNLSGDPRQEYFSDGMTEELIAQIGRLQPGRLRVIGRASAMRFRDGDQDDIGRIARELNVGYVLRGSVRRSGERVRITTALVRTSDQIQIWTRTYDARLPDILALQIEVARAVAREIPIGGASPEPAETAGSPRPVNPEAYEAYLEGRYFWNKFSRDAERKALSLFQRSIELDPDYAPAHAGLSAAFGVLSSVLGAIPPREGEPKAGAAARRSLELDDTFAWAHVQLGWYQLKYEWDFAGARASFRRAIELDPSSSAALHADATSLVVVGRLDEALMQMRRAIELDPLWLIAKADLCMFLYFARRYDSAIAECNRTLEMEPNFPPAHYYLAQIYEATGRYEEAFRSYQTLSTLMGTSPGYIAAGKEAYAKSGWKGASEKSLEMQLAARRKKPVPAFYIANSYIRLGKKDQALEWLEKACDERHYEVVFLKVAPKFDSLRSDPRFERLLRRMGLGT